MHISSARTTHNRLHMLDGLRGLCALLVMIYHYLSWNQIEFFQIGTFGVYIFFIISGFSIWHAYAHKAVDRQSIRQFYVARFARIFPLYLLVSLWSYIDSTTLKTLVLNATFLFGVAAPGLTSGITGGWSIGIEWVFYLIFPLFWVFLPSLWVMAGLCLAAIGINQLYVGSLFRQATLGAAWVDYSNFPVFLVYFIVGMCCAMIYQRIQSIYPAGFRRIPEWGLRFGILLCLAIVFIYPSDTVEQYLWGSHFTLLVAAASLSVLLCSFIHNLSGFTRRLCTFLGDISFSAYLIHYYVYKYGMRYFTENFPELGLYYVISVLGTITVCVAYVLFRFYEMPARCIINEKFAHRASEQAMIAQH